MEYSKNINYELVKDYTKRIVMTDRSRKLVEYGCKGSVEEFSKILSKYIWVGTRDVTMVMVIASIFVLAKKGKDKLSVDYIACVPASTICNIFYYLGLGVGPQAVKYLGICTPFKQLFDEILSKSMVDNDKKALKKREEKWKSFVNQVGKITPWKISASAVNDCLKPAFEEMLPKAVSEAFKTGLNKQIFIEERYLPKWRKFNEAEDVLSRSKKFSSANPRLVNACAEIEKALLTRPHILSTAEFKLANACFKNYGGNEEKYVEDVAEIVNIIRVGGFVGLPGFNMKDFVNKCKLLPKRDWVVYLGDILKDLCIVESGKQQYLKIIQNLRKACGDSDGMAGELRDYVDKHLATNSHIVNACAEIEKTLLTRPHVLTASEFKLANACFKNYDGNEKKYVEYVAEIVNVIRVGGFVGLPGFNMKDFVNKCKLLPKRDWVVYLGDILKDLCIVESGKQQYLKIIQNLRKAYGDSDGIVAELKSYVDKHHKENFDVDHFENMDRIFKLEDVDELYSTLLQIGIDDDKRLDMLLQDYNLSEQQRSKLKSITQSSKDLFAGRYDGKIGAKMKEIVGRLGIKPSMILTEDLLNNFERIENEDIRKGVYFAITTSLAGTDYVKNVMEKYGNKYGTAWPRTARLTTTAQETLSVTKNYVGDKLDSAKGFLSWLFS